jgi:hypothetical protein
MSATHQETQARFFREALYTHLRQVESYFASALSRLEDVPDTRAAEERRRFAEQGRTLVIQVEQLCRLVRFTRNTVRLNTEQVEAKIARLHALLAENRQMLEAEGAQNASLRENAA